MSCSVPKLVVTGGPCGGKSTGLTILRQKLRDYGVTAIVVPEIATQLFTNGIEPAKVFADPGRARLFQKTMVAAQMALEDQWQKFAALQPGTSKVLICDRGALDPAAYIDREEYERILYEEGLSIVDVRDRRYVAVFHMVTAAQGAEEFYNLDNEARSETPEQARVLDGRTLAAWTGHPRLTILGNVETGVDGKIRRIPFEEKLERLLRSACRALGLPVTATVEHKFTVRSADKLPNDTSSVEIEQTYLTPLEQGVERRVRRITPVGSLTAPGGLYIYTEKRTVRAGVRIPTERILSHREYSMLLKDADPIRRTIRKLRHAFTWNGRYYRLDQFSEPRVCNILEVEVTDGHSDVRTPPFIDVIEDVSLKPEFLNASMAKIR